MQLLLFYKSIYIYIMSLIAEAFIGTAILDKTIDNQESIPAQPSKKNDPKDDPKEETKEETKEVEKKVEKETKEENKERKVYTVYDDERMRKPPGDTPGYAGGYAPGYYDPGYQQPRYIYEDGSPAPPPLGEPKPIDDEENKETLTDILVYRSQIIVFLVIAFILLRQSQLATQQDTTKNFNWVLSILVAFVAAGLGTWLLNTFYHMIGLLP